MNWIYKTSLSVSEWAARGFGLLAVFFAVSVSAEPYVLVCGSYDAATSTFVPVDIGNGALLGACDAGSQIWVQTSVVMPDPWGGLTMDGAVLIGGAVLGVWGFAWVLKRMRRVVNQ